VRASCDDWCPPNAVDAFEAAVKKAGNAVEIFRYNARHSFMKEQEPDANNRKTAGLAWACALAFWFMHL